MTPVERMTDDLRELCDKMRVQIEDHRHPDTYWRIKLTGKDVEKFVDEIERLLLLFELDLRNDQVTRFENLMKGTDA